MSAGDIVDVVNKPSHYLTGKIEVIDFILDQKLDYLPGQVVKYICRAKHKGAELQDLQKAQFYLNRAIVKLKEAEGCKIKVTPLPTYEVGSGTVMHVYNICWCGEYHTQ